MEPEDINLNPALAPRATVRLDGPYTDGGRNDFYGGTFADEMPWQANERRARAEASLARVSRDTSDTAILNPAIAEHRRQLRDACIASTFGRGAHITTILAEANAMAELVYPRKV